MSKDSETENESFLTDKIEPKKMDVLVEDFTESGLILPQEITLNTINNAKINDKKVFEPIFEVCLIYILCKHEYIRTYIFS